MEPREVAFIHFVTRRQGELRGIREVAFALYICALMTLIVWVRDAPAPFKWMVVLAFSIVVQEAAIQLVDWRYNSSYGRVNPRRGPWAAPTKAQSLFAVGAVLDATRWFPLAGVSGFLLVVAIYGTGIAVRDFPWRGYHLAGILLLLVAPPVDDPTRMLSHLPAYFAGASWLILTGLCDHVLLVRAMTRVRHPARSPLPDTRA